MTPYTRQTLTCTCAVPNTLYPKCSNSLYDVSSVHKNQTCTVKPLHKSGSFCAFFLDMMASQKPGHNQRTAAVMTAIRVAIKAHVATLSLPAPLASATNKHKTESDGAETAVTASTKAYTCRYATNTSAMLQVTRLRLTWICGCGRSDCRNGHIPVL